MDVTDKRCPFRKYERDDSYYRKDEQFQRCLGKNCMAFVKIQGQYACGLIVKPILHQEVEMV